MKVTSAYILTMLLSFAGGLFFPWWIIAVAAFIVAVFIPLKPLAASLTATGAIATLWGGMATFISLQNANILATKVAGILPLGGSVPTLITITTLIGGLVAGLAATSGAYFRLMLMPQKETKSEQVQLER